MYACMYVCMYCMYVCMYVCVNIYFSYTNYKADPKQWDKA